MKQLNFIWIILSCICTSCYTKKKDPAINNVTELNIEESATFRSIFVRGIDISKYQGDEIDFLTTKKDSLSFIICKATEGRTGRDSAFKNNWKMIREKGFTRGAYHIYHTKDTPESQVKHFLSAVGTLLNSDLPPILDFEEISIDKSDKKVNIQKNVLIFLKQIAQKTKRTPIIYTDNNTAERYLRNAQFANYGLWIACYHPDAIEPTVPIAWKNKKWTFWQKSHEYKISNTLNDFDVFYGNKTDLETYINSTIIK
jgi:lysozyme